MQTRHVFRTVIVSSLVAAMASIASAGQPVEFRAFWADAFSVGYKSPTQITDMINRAVAGRYNAIFVEVVAFHDNVGTGHGAYYNSAIIPKAQDITPSNLDPLAQTIVQAHAAGLEVHAWIVPYRVSSNWPPSGNALLAANPEWLMVPRSDMGGGPATVGSYYTLDPGSPDAQEYLTSIVQELVANYAIDGINLDYIRYIQTDAGYPAITSYADSSLERFKRQTGFVGTPPATGNSAWNDFRRQTIDEYVKRLRAEIPSIPNIRAPLRLTADLIAFGNAPSSFTSADAYILHQNWAKWMQMGWIDMGIPMNYKREHTGSQAQWYRNWVDAALSNWSYDRHLACGQGNYLNTKANSVAQLAYALNAGADGIVTFSYDATADENTNGTPESDWTWYTSYLPTNLFTQVAITPDMPWRDPATATEGTLWGRVMNDTTNEPIERAIIDIPGQPTIYTDGNGYYVATLLPATQSGTAYDISADSPDCPQANDNGIMVFAGDIARHDFNLCPSIDVVGDMDEDGDLDSTDFNFFLFCMQGPDSTYSTGNFCLNGDGNEDADVDMRDMAQMQRDYGIQ